jgi:hypothetical protein
MRVLLPLFAFTTAALTYFSAYMVRADEVDSIPLEVLPVQPDPNNQPDALQARLLRNDLSDVEVTIRLHLAETGVISTRHARMLTAERRCIAGAAQRCSG